MSHLVGKWKFTQQWDNQRPYTFVVEIKENGFIEIPGGQYFGVYKQEHPVAATLFAISLSFAQKDG